MASDQSNDSKLDSLLPGVVAVKVEPPSSPYNTPSPPIYSETVIIKEELILDDDYLCDEEEEEKEEEEEDNRPDEYFKCKTCQKTFSNRKILTKHMLIHFAKQYEQFINAEVLDKLGLIKCTTCRKSFKKFRPARMHFDQHLNSDMFKYVCKLCNLGFPKQDNFNKHMLTHEKKKTVGLKYQCNQCDKSYKEKSMFAAHLRRHKSLEEGKFKCKPCSKFYASRRELESHVMRMHNILPEVNKFVSELSPDMSLYCNRCDIQFDSNNAFKAHQPCLQMATEQLPEQHSVFVKEEPREDSQIAVFCYEAVTKEEVIINDELTENQPSGDECSNGPPEDAPADENQSKHFKCPECLKLFKRKKFAKTCEKKHEIIRLGLFECKLCNQRFGKKQHLADHMESHSRGTIKMFVCNICSRRFSSKQHLEKHEKGQCKMFECQICKKIFATERNFHRHMLTHTKRKDGSPPRTSIQSTEVPVDNRKFQCPDCSKKFDRVNLVRGCMKKHEARKLGYFKCRFCLARLGTFQYLKKHEARHQLEQKTTNGKPDSPTNGQSFPPVINEDDDEAEDFDLGPEEALSFPGEPEEESKQFYTIEEIPESAVAKEELQNLLIKTEPDTEQIIPHTEVGVEFPAGGKIEVKEELIVPS